LESKVDIDINNPPFDKTGPPKSECFLSILTHVYFVAFVMISIYVLINILVAVLLKHLEVLIFDAKYKMKVFFQLGFKYFGN